MKFLETALGLLLLLPATAVAQDAHVFSEHKKQLKATLVYTDKMYLLRTAEQTIDVEFNFRLKDKASRPQPERVDLLMWSKSFKVQYGKHRGSDLVITVDGVPINIEKILYLKLQSDPSKRFEPINSFAAAQKTPPVTYAEWITVYIDPQEARKLATGKNVKLQLGNQELSFSSAQMNTVRDFAARIPLR